MFSEEMICSLNELELEVYKYVVRNADKVCYMRIREFADAAHVSTSTILRFCKKAGCDGYAEFKIRLRQHLEQAKQPPVKDDVSEVIDFLKKTCSAEFEQKLDMLTKVIFQARHIFFVGSGMSGIVAKYGARYFSSMGKFCLYIDEPHYPTESRFVENSLVIVFSVSGESRDTIGHVMRFKEQNCQILSVTNTENCTIAKLSDYNLAYYVTYERLGVYDVTTQLPAMSIVERLGKKLYRYTSEGMSTLTKDKQSLEAMYRKGWQDAEKLVQWYRAAKAEA